jgi:hypothetical protein
MNKLGFAFLAALVVCSPSCAGAGGNSATDSARGPINTPQRDILWPEERAFPTFAAPDGPACVIQTGSLTQDERVTFSALQGIVNAKKPRILLTESGDVPANTWPDTFGVERVDYSSKTTRGSKAYQLVEMFKDEIKGLVLYSCKNSLHYRNAACTVAGSLGNYLPVTQDVFDAITKMDVVFAPRQIVDITTWTERTSIDIYNKLYNEYWNNCTKRLIVSADPARDLDHARDMAAAAGAAVVYLDCTNANERKVYQKFIKDMADAPGTAIAMGWFTTERSGITAGSEFGVSTVPADLYISSTYYAGITYNSDPSDRTINVPPMPPVPALENKAYIAVYITDGDNVQYVQRYMRKLWDSAEERANRGNVPINWTISPSLVDLGPGIMNWYYSQATDKECFVSGPSGLGYLMPVNTLYERGAAAKDFLVDQRYMDNYTKLTETYLRLAGLRVITIWDDATQALRETFARNTPYLYGATVQNFGNGTVREGIAGNRLYFARLKTHYEGVTKIIYDGMRRELQLWNREKPLFLSYQVKVWSNDDGSYTHTPQIVRMYDDLRKEFGDKVEFVRADHFFLLYNEANGLSL